MVKTIASITFFFLFLTFNVAYSQDIEIKGAVYTEDGIALNGSILQIINQQDSIIHTFGRTDKEGKFSFLAPVDTGQFFLIAIYPKHTDVFIPFHVDDTFSGRDFGTIELPLNSVFLEEVVITAKGLMSVNGDTLEYNIGALKFEPNARIEDIINDLPGMQITRGGQIYSHGQIIERVLVDGEPFFGNDPTLVTKNIRADMVDKIQVYDDISENEKITGIVDSDRRKTIDVKLKEDKKSGMFGSAEGGYLNNYYNNVVMLNTFRGNRKIFGYGALSNTGKLGVGYKNMVANGSALGNQFDSSTGKFLGEGTPKVYSGGLSYSNIWNRKKLNTSVSISGMNVEGTKDIYELIDPDVNPLSNTRNTDFQRKSHNQSFRINYENEVASKIYLDLQVNHSKQTGFIYQDSYLKRIADNVVAVHSNQVNNSNGDDFTTSLNANWSKELSKKGRRISIGISPELKSSKMDNQIILETNNLGEENADHLEIAKQKLDYKINSNLVYSEPVFNGSLINSFENKNHSVSNAVNTTSNNLAYEDRFSGDHRYSYIENKLKSIYRRSIDKFSGEIGTAISFDRSLLKDIDTQISLKNDFIFFQPLVNLRYNISSTHRLEFRYSKNNIAPTLLQVQPITYSDDFINMYSGNKYLEPESVSKFYFNYYNFKLNKLRALNSEFEFNVKNNAVGYNINTLSEGNLISPVNIKKNIYSYTFHTTYGKEISKKKDYLWLPLDMKKELSYSYINSIENRIISTFIDLRPSFAFIKRGGIRFGLAAGPSYERIKYSENTDFNYEGFGIKGTGNVDIDLPLKFQLKQNFNYLYKPKYTFSNTSLNQLLWDASLTKLFGKNDNFTLELSVNDLLNKNTGLQRVYGNTGFTESRYSTIKRYFLLTIKFDINKMKG
ncbi:porin family protein [Albibacterium bauzanense]|uniref:Outer membrane receptor protein involved in Fe transport n=1 Tax=Albibacterium bauzanense TaxID=653929 RepID=A0A4V6NF53_9SPHI|nr:outer membrane beta-barrel protein [Albibacterium bauzanense]TCK85091.1 outer membrane receptor protein involved in Fe transport [Albibacterium bauzanense]